MVEFNFKSQIATTIEQSERMTALGLKKETADMTHHYLNSIDSYELKDIEFSRIMHLQELVNKKPVLGRSGDDLYAKDIPAWSLHRLIEMMPLDVIIEGGFDNCFTLIKNYPKGYSVEYDGFSYYHKENIYDTIIEGIEHLIKEGCFNKEYFV